MTTQSSICSYKIASDFSSLSENWGDRAAELIKSNHPDVLPENFSESSLKPVSYRSNLKGSTRGIKARTGNPKPSQRNSFLSSRIPASKKNWDSQGIEMLIAYHQNPSVALRNKLVRVHAGLVRKVAHRFRHQCSEPYEDLEQIGYFGLIRAIERFDPHQGCAFSSFAIPYIRGEMLHFLRDKSCIVRVPRRWQELYNEGEKVQKALVAKLGRSPKDAEIAQALQVSLQEWRESKLAAQNRQPLSLDATVNQQVDCPMSLAETLPDTHYQSLQNWEEERQQLQGALNQLEEKTRAAIECVFLRELPRKEAAKRIGVSPMTVTRHLQKGVEQLVTLLHSQPAELAS